MEWMDVDAGMTATGSPCILLGRNQPDWTERGRTHQLVKSATFACYVFILLPLKYSN